MLLLVSVSSNLFGFVFGFCFWFRFSFGFIKNASVRIWHIIRTGFLLRRMSLDVDKL